MVRVVKGKISKGDKIEIFQKRDSFGRQIEFSLLRYRPSRITFRSGRIYRASIKKQRAPVGDTIIKANSGTENLEGFQEVNPQVYAALFPQDSDDFEAFREALESYV